MSQIFIISPGSGENKQYIWIPPPAPSINIYSFAISRLFFMAGSYTLAMVSSGAAMALKFTALSLQLVDCTNQWDHTTNE